MSEKKRPTWREMVDARMILLNEPLQGLDLDAAEIEFLERVADRSALDCLLLSGIVRKARQAPPLTDR